MAETPIFESEKQLKRQRRRRVLLIIAVIALAVAAAVAFGLISASCNGKPQTGGEDLPYSYTWARAADGSAKLSVAREGELVWRIDDAGDAFGTVGVTCVGSKADATEFKLAPISEGRSIVKLILGEKEGTAGDKYSMELLTEAFTEGGKLCCRVLSASCAPICSVDVSDGAFPYSIHMDDDGDIVIEVPGAAEDWECVSSNEAAASVIGVILSESSVRAYIRAGSEPGTSEVVLRSVTEGRELKAEFSLNEADEFALVKDEAKVTATEAPAETDSPAGTEAPAPIELPEEIGATAETEAPAATEAPAETVDP